MYYIKYNIIYYTKYVLKRQIIVISVMSLLGMLFNKMTPLVQFQLNQNFAKVPSHLTKVSNIKFIQIMGSFSLHGIQLTRGLIFGRKSQFTIIK